MSRKDLGYRAIFGGPLVISGLALAGLFGALLGDGAADWLGAGLLAVAPAAVAWALAARRR